MKKIEKWIIQWFQKNSNIDDKEILDYKDENYFSNGWIDSLKFISFITDIENEFEVNFLNDEFQNRKFATINGIIEIIKERVNGKK